MSADREQALAKLRQLRALAPTPAAPPASTPFGRTGIERRTWDAEEAARLVDEHFVPFGTEVLTGTERRETMVWLSGVTEWWTTQDELRALDDLTAGLPLQEVLRICSEEGFTVIGDREVMGDRHIFLLSEDGLFAEVFLNPGPAGDHTPWSLTVYGNLAVEDFLLFARCHDEMRLETAPGGRRVATGRMRWNLCYASGSSGSFRAAMAALRASCQTVTPWEFAPIRGWLGGDSPRGMAGHPSDEIARVARANTRDALDDLPRQVHDLLGPRLMAARPAS
ncbi:hypothetical protein ACFORH_43350 [Amycolatopsis roodepoortensis]|uniref:SMI1/KNR4 family protein n=1 Tax=Amycolatopsis roodepoortensis TaxID=700274 RepID=A0ABR9LK20_9PSEU|nr:hypothetical protein [Amycolatopsis roodepoortensis]MBE1580421.1 hypothetical protein [Amycolatopsis roodepoortensis]